MAKDPWKDPDPQPGDFDAELDHTQVEIHEGNSDAKLSISSAGGRRCRPCCVMPAPMEATPLSG
jgi:hypothetical protein